MSAKRWWVDDPEFQKLLISEDGATMHSFVLASDYDALSEELERYKRALWEANGYRIQSGLEPVKLTYAVPQRGDEHG